MKSLILFLSIFFSFFLNFNCQAEIPSDIQNIIARKKLIVALPNKEYPPFFYHNRRNELEGLDIDMAKDIAHHLGVKLEFNTKAQSFNAVVDEVENNNADIGIGAMSASLSRGLHVAFSKPYLIENKVLILNRVLNLKLESQDSSLKSNQLKIAVIKDSSYETFLKENFFSISKFAVPSGIVTFDSLDEAMSQLMEGKLYALFTDGIRANYLMSKHSSANIYSKKEVIKEQVDPVCIIVNFKNQALLDWINLFVDTIEYNGTKSFLARKHLKGLK